MCNKFVTHNQKFFSGLKSLATRQLDAEICAKHFILIYVVPLPFGRSWMVENRGDR
jgi:hypothetical protein